MTRETKIGLLIGLGFIVVFAVLLSHTGQAPPAGDDRDLVLARHEQGPGGLSGAGVVADAGASRPAVEEGPSWDGRSLSEMIDGSPRGGDSWDRSLPQIDGLEPPPDRTGFSFESDGVLLTGTSPARAEPDAVVHIMRRTAPPAMPVVLADPSPTARPASPEASPEPALRSDPGVPPARTVPPEEYLVKKGDSLGIIAAQVYGTSAPRVVDFLAASNKERIKSKDLVLAGQKLRILELPPDLVEHVGSFAPAEVNTAVRLARSGESTREASSDNSPPARRAPRPALKLMVSGDGADGAAERSPDNPRWYVVKPKDTLTSIAKEQLGSSGLWRDIQALNRTIEPTKMRPGIKIRLPRKRASAGADDSGRTSA